MKTIQIRAVLLVLSFLFFNQVAKSQSTVINKADSVKMHRAQNVFLEVGAAGLFYSANYDTRFSQQRNGLGGTLGVGTWNSNGTTFITVPLQFNYLLGKRSHFLELGAGATLMSLNKAYYGNPILKVGNVQVVNTTVLPVATIGYRYQPFNGGLNLRTSFNPTLLEGTFIPNFGFSAGYTFK